MSRRSQKAAFRERALQSEAQESLERRWSGRQHFDSSLAWMVTGERNHLEPFHRWLHFKQSFSPELVRRFLRAVQDNSLKPVELPMLDPFGGAGTFVIECSRRGVPALAVEAMPSLAFLANARMQPVYEELAETPNWESWQTAAAAMEHPLHRAALMIAFGQQHQADGTPLAKPLPLPQLFEQVCRMMRDDLRRPLEVMNSTEVGDARSLEEIEDESIGGILTSPPYLSRHDYERVLRPHEKVHAFWYPPAEELADQPRQIAAHPTAKSRPGLPQGLHPAVHESMAHLQSMDRGRLPSVVATYFEDMNAVMAVCGRVLQPGGTMWLVVGGVRLKEVLIPTDLILADMGERHGFGVTEIHVARRLVDSGRKLGNLTNVSPRESIIEMIKQ